MINRLIKTKEDYSRALGRIEPLMDAETGTTEADELATSSLIPEKYWKLIGSKDPISS